MRERGLDYGLSRGNRDKSSVVLYVLHSLHKGCTLRLIAPLYFGVWGCLGVERAIVYDPLGDDTS